MGKTVIDEEILGLVHALQHVDDPRVQGRCKHKLIDILVLSVCATMCGAEGITEIEEFGLQKEDWLLKYLELPAGIPSHDTIARVLSLIDGKQLEAIFTEWVQAILSDKEKAKSISLDGKSTKGTLDGFGTGQLPLHVVSAFSHDLGLCLTESLSNGSGGEAKAALECLQRLDLEGVTVMADAGLNSAKIIQEIIGRKGQYLMPLKKNHRFAYHEACRVFSEVSDYSLAVTTEAKTHGRFEQRTCKVLSPSHFTLGFQMYWPEVKTVFQVDRVRESKDKRFSLQKTDADGKQYYERNVRGVKREETTHYYVSSLKLNADECLREVRKHWLIENQLHWVLDVAFGEDNWAVRAKKLARTLSLIRKFSLNLIRNSKAKGSVRVKMKRASWNTDFLEELIFT